MATTAPVSPDKPAPGDAGEPKAPLLRFDRVERVCHWLTALLFLVLIFTGASLYIPALVGFVGRRVLIVRIHIDCGLALPLPLLVSLAGSWGRGLRADVRRLNRWTYQDRKWFRYVLHRQPIADLPTGKFNAGQKLNAAFVLGVMAVMLMTGSIMRWVYLWPLSWRDGATFIHDLFAYFLVAVVVGHIFMAVTHPQALRSIFTGRVNRAWAKRHASLWLEEVDAQDRRSKKTSRRVDPSR